MFQKHIRMMTVGSHWHQLAQPTGSRQADTRKPAVGEKGTEDERKKEKKLLLAPGSRLDLGKSIKERNQKGKRVKEERRRERGNERKQVREKEEAEEEGVEEEGEVGEEAQEEEEGEKEEEEESERQEEKEEKEAEGQDQRKKGSTTERLQM